MIEFYNTHKEAFIYVCIVIGVVLVLRFLTKLLHNRLEKLALKKYPNEDPKTIHLTKRILNALWIVLGIMAFAFIFIDEEHRKAATSNFFHVLYLGIIAVPTLVIASFVQIWFTRNIQRKKEQEQDATSYKFLRYVVIVGVYFIGILMAILAFPSLRHIGQTVLSGAGVVAVIAGVASQEALANLIVVFLLFRLNLLKLVILLK